MKLSELLAQLQPFASSDPDVEIQCDGHFDAQHRGSSSASGIASVHGVAGAHISGRDSAVIIVPSEPLDRR